MTDYVRWVFIVITVSHNSPLCRSYGCSHWDLSNADNIYKKIKVCTTKKRKGKKKAMYQMDTWNVSVLETFLLVLLLAKEHFFKVHFIVHVLPQHPVEWKALVSLTSKLLSRPGKVWRGGISLRTAPSSVLNNLLQRVLGHWVSQALMTLC